MHEQDVLEQQRTGQLVTISYRAGRKISPDWLNEAFQQSCWREKAMLSRGGEGGGEGRSDAGAGLGALVRPTLTGRSIVESKAPFASRRLELRTPCSQPLEELETIDVHSAFGVLHLSKTCFFTDTFALESYS